MHSGEQSTAMRIIDGWNSVFHALSAEPRRQIVASLLEAPTDRMLSLPEAANPPYALRDPQTLTLELEHVHLPLLEEGSYVTAEHEPLQVGRGPNFAEVGVVIDALQQRADVIPDRLVHGCQRLEEHRDRASDPE